MIRVERPSEPETFDETCRQPGNRWLREHPETDPHSKPLWASFRGRLKEAFHRRCGLLAHRVGDETVDHWLSIKNNRELAYEWSNYRWISGTLNSAKKPCWDGKLLDPFEVEDDWFEILLPSLQMVLVASLPEPVRKRAEFTMNKLHLRDGTRVLDQRGEWLALYEKNGITFEVLQYFAPLIAKAVAKRDGLEIESKDSAAIEPSSDPCCS